MPRSRSGRLVIQVEPHFKRKLYDALAIENCTLKDWFVSAAQEYLASHEPPRAEKKNKTRKGQTS